MPSSAVKAGGTLLKIGDGGGSETFTTIAEVKDIEGPSMEASLEEVTSHDSGNRREFIATLLDNGEVTFDINYYSAATQDSLRTDLNNQARRNFQLVFPLPSPETWSFAAFVTGFQLSAPVEGALTASVTIKLTSAITVT